MGSSPHSMESAERVRLPTFLILSRIDRKGEWCADIRFIPLPKSDTKERIIANIDLYDFELSDDQMGRLNALDKDEHVCINVTDCP